MTKLVSEDTREQMIKFRDERDWLQFHNPKDVAISLSIEASELLEVFQWSGTDLNCEAKKERIAEELADVMCYAISLADVCGLDLDEIVQAKMKKNIEKYPVKLCRGKTKKYTELQHVD